MEIQLEPPRAPIIKGENDCFFEDMDSDKCLHVRTPYNKCIGFTCELYKPAIPLRKKN